MQLLQYIHNIKYTYDIRVSSVSLYCDNPTNNFTYKTRAYTFALDWPILFFRFEPAAPREQSSHCFHCIFPTQFITWFRGALQLMDFGYAECKSLVHPPSMTSHMQQCSIHIICFIVVKNTLEMCFWLVFK